MKQTTKGTLAALFIFAGLLLDAFFIVKGLGWLPLTLIMAAVKTVCLIIVLRYRFKFKSLSSAAPRQ